MIDRIDGACSHCAEDGREICASNERRMTARRLTGQSLQRFTAQKKAPMMSASSQTAKPQAKLARYIPILAWLPHYDRFLVDRGHDCRADAVGAGRAGGDGLRRHRRVAAAGGSLHAAGGAARVRDPGHVAPSGRAGDLSDRGAAGFVGGGGAGGDRGGERVRSGDLPGLRGGLRAGDRSRLPGRGGGQAGLHHPVPLQAGDGWLCHGSGHLRGGGPAQQALRRAQARGQHRGEADRHRPGAAPGELGHLCRRRRGAGAALPAAPLEQEDPGRPGRAVRRHHPQHGVRYRGPFGIEVVGTLPQGLPSLAFPLVPWTAYLAMVLPAIGVLLVAYSEALGVAHEFAEKHGYEVDANQELNAHAAANLLSALFGGMIAAGSMSASAVKEGAGARSQVTNLVTWVVTIITLLFLTPLFAPLPEAVLAALIIHAVWHIIAALKLWHVRLVTRTEFWLGALALAGVLLIDVLQGMIIGVVASLVYVIYRSSRPHVSSLGRVPGVPGAYADLTRHPECTPVPGVLIVRADGVLYFANALTIRERVKAMIEEMQPPPKTVIIDASAQDQLVML